MPKLIVDNEKKKILMLNAQRCQGCELCVAACPTGVLELSDQLNVRNAYPPRVKKGKEKGCMFCHRCEYACPVWAMYVLDDSPTEEEKTVPATSQNTRKAKITTKSS